MDADSIIKAKASLAAGRDPLDAHWNELAYHYLPFRKITHGAIPELHQSDQCFDSTARRSAIIMANGLSSLVTPREEIWFEFQPPRELRENDEAVRFYRQVSEVARELIESSNFYEEMQECYLESPVFGTTCLFLGEAEDDGIYFLNQPIGSYYISEDSRRRVNCVYRDLQYTADQAAEEFGLENLPDQIRSKVGNPSSKTQTFSFIHAVFKRTEIDQDKKQKPFASIVVSEQGKKVVQDDGYDEFPFAVHRYRRHGRCPWGFGCGSIALADPRQLEHLNQLMDVATEKAVFPPVQAPNNLEGEIGLGSLEITYLDATDPNSPHMLKEWGNSGRIDYAAARIEDKRKQIEEAFHVDLFQLFANRTSRQPLSATEASYAAAEKITQFSPVFGRLVSEMLDPILTRIFGIIIRRGYAGAIPPVVTKQLANGNASVALPGILYKNRIMLAMQTRNNRALMEYMTLVQPILSLYPQAADIFNFPKISRETSRNAGLPEGWLRTEQEEQKIQAARIAQAQQQEQLAQAQALADTAQKIGKTPQSLRDQIGLP